MSVLRMSVDANEGRGEVALISVNDSMPRRILSVRHGDDSVVTVTLSPAEAKILAKALEVEP